MSPTDSVRTCLRNYAAFGGRAPRSEFWWFVLFFYLVVGVLVSIDEGTGSVAFLALLVPLIAASVRRLHDTDRSGWSWLLVLIPLIGGIILIIFLTIEGDRGPNRYGEPPIHLKNRRKV